MTSDATIRERALIGAMQLGGDGEPVAAAGLMGIHVWLRAGAYRLTGRPEETPRGAVRLPMCIFAGACEYAKMGEREDVWRSDAVSILKTRLPSIDGEFWVAVTVNIARDLGIWPWQNHG